MGALKIGREGAMMPRRAAPVYTGPGWFSRESTGSATAKPVPSAASSG